MRQLKSIQPRSCANGSRAGNDATLVAVFSDGERRGTLLQLVGQVNVRGSGGGEVSLFGVVRTFFIVDAVDQFRDEKVEVRVALTVRMGAHVDRHAGDESGKVGTVVQIEAAQEILVGFAIAAMLGDDDPGHEFEQFSGAQCGAVFDQLGGDRPLTGRIGTADCILVVVVDLDFVYLFDLAYVCASERRMKKSRSAGTTAGNDVH